MRDEHEFLPIQHLMARLNPKLLGRAYWDGVDVSDNPYDEETKERRSWEEGWRATRKNDYDKTEG